MPVETRISPVLSESETHVAPAGSGVKTSEQGPTPIQTLFTDFNLDRSSFAPHARTARESGLPLEVSGRVARIGVAAANQSETRIQDVATGLDAISNHPALKSRFEEQGSMSQVDMYDTLSSVSDGLNTRREVAARTALLVVNEDLNRMNGHGPKGEARQQVVQQAVKEVIRIVDEESKPAETNITSISPIREAKSNIASVIEDERDDELDTPMMLAVIGTSEGGRIQDARDDIGYDPNEDRDPFQGSQEVPGQYRPDKVAERFRRNVIMAKAKEVPHKIPEPFISLGRRRSRIY